MKTVLQSTDEENKACGAACVAMLTNRNHESCYKRFYPSGKSRNLKKRELLKVLGEYGYRSGSAGKFSKLTSVTVLQENALLFGRLLEDREYGHWLVWDAKERVIRDPYGYRAPFKLTSYTLIRRK